MADDNPVAEKGKAPDSHSEHELRGIGILCPADGCRKFILFDPAVYQERKTATFAQITILILSTMAVLLLSGLTTDIWPLYVFFILGVVLLYTAIFSRGATLGLATWVLGLIAVIWLLWQSFSKLFGLSMGTGQWTGLAARLLPPVIWILFTTSMYFVGKGPDNLEAVKKPGAYFLTVGSLTFGFWGVWLILLESDLVGTGLYQLAIGIGLLLPLVCVGLLILQTPSQKQSAKDSEDSPAGSGGRWNLVALWLVVVATYLVLIEPLIRSLAFVLGRLLPLAVGREPLADVTVDWLGGPGWRAVVTSALLIIAITLVAVRSVMEVSEAEALPKNDTYVGPMPQPPLSTAAAAAAATDQEALSVKITDSVTAVAEAVADTTIHNLRDTGYAGTYYGKIGLQFAKNVYLTARHVFSIAVPIAIFTALSILVILVLGAFQDYRGHGPFFAATSLWGTGLTTWIVVVIACGLAFEFAPNQTRDAGRPMVETGAASLLGGLLFFMISLVSVALLPLWLYPRDSSTQLGGFVPGEIYFANLLLSMTALSILVALTLFFRTRLREQADRAKDLKDRLHEQEERTRRQKIYDYSYTFAAIVLLLLGGAALYFALPPIQVAATYVTSAYEPSADSELRSQLPATLVASCSRDHMMLDGYKAGLVCRNDGIEVSYHLFATDAQLNGWYAQAIAQRGLPASMGTCGSTDPAEGAYNWGTQHGRIACYTDRGRSWLIWTNAGSRTLGIARSSSHTLSDLYTGWTAGSLT